MKYSAFLLVLLASVAQAEVYKSINSKGEVVYSDVPSKGSERMRLPELPTYTPAPLPATPAQPPASPAAVAAGYTSLELNRPRNDETIRSNAGILNVSVQLEPALQVEAGHRVQFFMDGKPLGEPAARLSASFKNMDRGTHSLAAAIIDENGASLITAAPVTIHLLRASILQPSNPLNPANKAKDSSGDSGSEGDNGGTTDDGGSGDDSSGTTNSTNTNTTSSSTASSSSSSTSSSSSGASGSSGGISSGGSTGGRSRSVGF